MKTIIVTIAFLITFIFQNPIYAQTDQPEKLQCTAAPASADEPKTYLVGAGKLSKAEKKRLEEKWGKLALPDEKELKAAIERRKFIASARQKRVAELESNYNQWIENAPNATAEEKQRWRKITDDIISSIVSPPRDKTLLAMKSFDWRNQADLGVWNVTDQGNCNTCWAFASVDAAAASLKKQYFDSISGDYRFTDPARPGTLIDLSTPPPFNFPGDPRPFVQDLLNCMPLDEKEMCNQGWHGKAFNYMVENGIPTSYDGSFKDSRTGLTHGFIREYRPGKKFACNPTNGFYGVLAWDYVNSPPDKLPSVEQLKQALIEHGPLVAPIVFDNCLKMYRSGVFNEQNLSTVNHVVLLVGWDDDKEAWLVKNSWGEEWGEKGFAWIKYGSNNIGMFAAWIDADFESFRYSPANPLGSDPDRIKTGCSDFNDAEYLIYGRIKDIYASGKDIVEVEITDGIVTLDGRVETKKVRNKIYNEVKKYRKENTCIKKIVNNLTVVGQS